MAGQDSEPRLYGAPDDDNRQPMPEQGLRGEQGAEQPARTDLTHDLRTPTGQVLEVQEQSGVAFTESTGTAGIAGDDPADPAA